MAPFSRYRLPSQGKRPAASAGSAGTPADEPTKPADGSPATLSGDPRVETAGSAGTPAGEPTKSVDGSPAAVAGDRSIVIAGSAGTLAGDSTSESRPCKGWHSRGYLPHLDEPGLVQSITYRLHDSVPAALVDKWKAELQWAEGLPAGDQREIELRHRIERYADQGNGSCWLRRAEIAGCVEETFLHFDAARYQLLAWCIMPNHVHVLIETKPGWPLEKVVHSWKSYTANEANRMLGRRGAFWFRDYFDRFIRDARHYTNALRYVEENPVTAGLANSASDWRFSSARRSNREVR